MALTLYATAPRGFKFLTVITTLTVLPLMIYLIRLYQPQNFFSTWHIDREDVVVRPLSYIPPIGLGCRCREIRTRNWIPSYRCCVDIWSLEGPQVLTVGDRITVEQCTSPARGSTSARTNASRPRTGLPRFVPYALAGGL
ncbi:uncharacterized protein N7483_006703 [Penicillium malachiteum]|uniref:uncharacterized protein n=1 Tax=Penicillium malachiteum TaxID=1324776 RepID=UPI002547708D|nr:uncharacterized protein N7483_006703 [Penicillium malachiteum]KAJ5725346.1 hypothetical protein N7483_006703 [Penicillium malachiteum]